ARTTNTSRGTKQSQERCSPVDESNRRLLRGHRRLRGQEDGRSHEETTRTPTHEETATTRTPTGGG
ncbi:unnamed protein product, partial [Amoebophrya sp. A25]